MPMEYTIIASVISVICTLIGVNIGAANMRRNQTQDAKQESAHLTRLSVQLEHIDKGVCSILHDISAIRADAKEHSERMVRVEESTKQAHKRLDEISGRRGA